jgi:hypothetical protein
MTALINDCEAEFVSRVLVSKQMSAITASDPHSHSGGRAAKLIGPIFQSFPVSCLSFPLNFHCDRGSDRLRSSVRTF